MGLCRRLEHFVRRRIHRLRICHGMTYCQNLARIRRQIESAKVDYELNGVLWILVVFSKTEEIVLGRARGLFIKDVEGIKGFVGI